MPAPIFDNSYARLPEQMFAHQPPVPVVDPTLLALNVGLAETMGLDAEWLASDDGVAMLAGNVMPAGATPIAMAYAGHQFGGWSPQLGDGRAVLLGETVHDGARYDIQLKGSGRTPFSRSGDGRAWLGPVLREYVISEFMHAAGVPTTRALAMVSTGERVQREQGFPGAVLTRVATSHIRVGTFQYFVARGDTAALQALTDHTIARHYPDAVGAAGLLRAAVQAQAELIAKWMGLGFVHGVMNTDNAHVGGLTIDYGPCAFQEVYQPNACFSSIDHARRYAYDNQPNIAAWNLAQLATSLLPLMGERDAAVEEATDIINGFAPAYADAWTRVFGRKIGLADADDQDVELIQDLMKRMDDGQADFTNTFRSLSGRALSGSAPRDQFIDPTAFDTWDIQWRVRLSQEAGDPRAIMDAANPAYIPRNHRIQEAIEAAVDGDLAPFARLDAALANPFTAHKDHRDLTHPADDENRVRLTFCGT